MQQAIDTQRQECKWTQIRETVAMLALAVGQIEFAMKDSDESVDTLTDTFTTLYGDIRLMITQLEASGREVELTGAGQRVSDQMQRAIVAMQFYDKLTQRLTHVSKSMRALANLIADPDRQQNDAEWFGLQEKIKAKYTLQEERMMFEAIMQGKTIDQALSESMTRLKERQSASDAVELF